jgi:hypothetical protein
VPKTYVYQRAEDLGLPVIDAKERVLVTVTNGDVVLAKRADSKHCALARASMRLPGVNAAYFFRSKAYLEYDDKIVRYSLPGSVQKEIVSFDRARVFAAGVYQLSPVSLADAPTSGAIYRKERKEKMKRAAKALERTQRKSIDRAAELARRSLGAKIDAIAARAPAPPDTPEQREFNLKIAGIVGTRAPVVLGPKKYLHRSQYVRTMSEPK